MISRRNIREKVMQSLYSIASMVDEGQSLSAVPYDQANKILTQKLNNAARNFTASILYITKIAEYAEIDAGKKASKFLPTDADLNVNTKIIQNKYLWLIKENETFQAKVKEENLHALINEEWVRKIYNKLKNAERYQNYIATREHNDEEDKKILIYIWKNMVLKDDNFQDILADEWTGYAEDKILNRTVIDFYFKNPEHFNFLSFLSEDKQKYAIDLLHLVIEKEAYLMELIIPKLNNWEPERIAIIDMILLKMGISEFLYFPTIPTKVTINEYVDIAKDYSTEDSGRFVNAVLDNILQDLTKQKMIEKKSLK